MGFPELNLKNLLRRDKTARPGPKTIRGGVHPEGRKELSCAMGIEALPMPQRFFVPVQQHIGAPASPVVSEGDRVLKGQLLAHSQGAISAPIHAPTSGIVKRIFDYPAPHPSGLPVLTIGIETDGKDEWAPLHPTADPFILPPEEIATRVGAAGIVGMGGATFPSAVKLGLAKRTPIHTLIMNGAECEPYLTCDDRLMRERAGRIVDGIRIMLRALGAARALVAIEDNKPEAYETMTAAAEAFAEVEIRQVPTRYPMGSEKHLIQALTGYEIPPRALSAELGLVVHNVGTAYAVSEALREGKPLISRIVTVTGGAVRKPKNLEVLIGTRVRDLVLACGEFSEEPERILMGGPMMGQTLPKQKVPIVKGTSGIVALTAAEVKGEDAGPCIRCASCVSACPCGLLPLEMANRSRIGDLDGAVDHGLLDCVSCGSCAYVCPSHIPLVQYFNYAKGELTNRQRAEHKTQETKRLAEQRTARKEKEKAEKARKAAERRAARKKAEEAKKAAEAAEESASPAPVTAEAVTAETGTAKSATAETATARSTDPAQAKQTVAEAAPAKPADTASPAKAEV
ncbi:MAG: electron transport complex subunit RsxC [Gammaproteobacteria bacterium]